MAIDTTPLHRSDLIIAPRGDGGSVIKDPANGAYFQLGPEEFFLFRESDGEKSLRELCDAFRKEFDEPISEEEAQEFVGMATEQGLLASPRTAPAQPAVMEKVAAITQPAPAPATPKSTQSIFHWRKSLFDPDRLFNRVEPLIRFVWTPTFLVLSFLVMLFAGIEVAVNGEELAAHVDKSMRWETVLFIWFAFVIVTTVHEFAHGLTCKHHGGEVHEVGFLMMFFMPCFYCNVSDTWLLTSKWKRMWVTMAGPYADMCMWAFAVFVWRLTPPDVMANDLAFAVMSICGVRTFLNANPFIKLDGYYFLSDYMEISNMQARAQAHLKGTLRWLLWGADRPAPDLHGRFLLAYGLGAWLFPLSMLTLLILTLGNTLATVAGPAGTVVAVFGGAWLLSGQLSGIFGEEVKVMTRTRPLRTAAWACLLLGSVAALAWWERADLTSGQFQLRPATRLEVRAEVAGFLREVKADEGEPVTAGQRLLLLEVPNLDSKLAQKRAEHRETEAKLKLLLVGPRPEMIAAQKDRLGRARSWRDLAKTDLAQNKLLLKADLARLDKEVAQFKTELDFAKTGLIRAQPLFAKGAMGLTEFETYSKKHEVSESQLKQTESKRQARVETGTLVAEAELVRREREFAEAQSQLELLEAGTRPEEIEAEKAHLDRVNEEIALMEDQRGKQEVYCPVAGVVTTPRLREAIGKYFREGELICIVEEPSKLEAEVTLDERAVARVQAGQPVELKVQVLPRETFTAHVDRIAPRALEEKDPSKAQSKLIAYCRLDQSSNELRPGMTGHARINCGQRPLGEIIRDRALRYLRTEYWWW